MLISHHRNIGVKCRVEKWRRRKWRKAKIENNGVISSVWHHRRNESIISAGIGIEMNRKVKINGVKIMASAGGRK
jgi:hypothetical protein